jgi:hypothetical protein
LDRQRRLGFVPVIPIEFDAIWWIEIWWQPQPIWEHRCQTRPPTHASLWLDHLDSAAVVQEMVICGWCSSSSSDLVTIVVV